MALVAGPCGASRFGGDLWLVGGPGFESRLSEVCLESLDELTAASRHPDQLSTQEDDDESLQDYMCNSQQPQSNKYNNVVNETMLDSQDSHVSEQPDIVETVPDSQVPDSQGSSQADTASSQKPAGSASSVSASKKRRQRKKSTAPAAAAISTRTTRSSTKTDDSRKQPEKNKGKKTKAKDIATCIMLRCGLCMDWFESEETEAGFWVCQTCRLLPANINTLLKENLL